MFKDYYAILDVTPRASGEEVRRAFKRLALQFHPDKITVLSTSPDVVTVTYMEGLGHLIEATESGCANTSAHASPTSQSNGGAPQQPPRSFTDIQEAYEVLGDVARRYLYDMNYQELLTMRQQEQQREEQQRRDAHARIVAEAMRRARERERQRHQQQQQERQAQLAAAATPRVEETPASSPAKAVVSTGGTFTEARHGPQASPRANETACSLEDIDADVGGEGNGDGGRASPGAYSSTAPSRSRRAGHPSRSRADTSGDKTSPPLARTAPQPRVADVLRRQRQRRLASALQATFLISDAVPLRWDDSTSSQVRAAGGKPQPRRRMQGTAASRDGTAAEAVLAELPDAYYQQRSIERTLQVFFGAPTPE